MEGIQGLRRQTAAPVQRAVSQSAVTRKSAAPARTDSFQSMLTEAERAEQAAKTPELPNFSKMTDKQKLSALATLHDATDYSGMTDVEKYKLMNDRFEAAFPHLGSYMGGLFGPAGVYYENPVDQANHVKTLPERIADERHRQFSTTGLSKVYELHREAYYSGMTDKETIAAINKRHSGGTMADRFDALYEMQNLRVGNAYGVGNAMFAMERSVRRIATGSMYGTSPYNDGQFRTACGYASGTKVSWAEVKKMAQAYAAELGGRISEGFGKTSQEAIDELFDSLLNAEL